jgi:ABC-type protease/lipase transport system fused ATPase/permease subunit
MADTKNTTTVSFAGLSSTLIFITFLLLKVLGYVDWPWWLVTLPLWYWIPLILGILALIGIVYLIALAIDKFSAWRRRRKRAKLLARRDGKK